MGSRRDTARQCWVFLRYPKDLNIQSMDHTGFFPSSVVLISLTVDLFTQVQTVVNCNNSFTNPQHCEFQPGGVHNLDCFSRRGVKRKIWTCEWQPGVGASINTYTLSIQHRGYCNTMSNITGLSKIIEIYKDTTDITALVLENSDSQNCTKSVFKGRPKDLLRCGPPLWSSFRRHSGFLNVSVGWPQREKKYIKKYIIRYKAMGDLDWNVTETYENGRMRHSLNPGQVYVVQVKCPQSDKCSQCPWSVPYVTPAELKTQPVLVNLEGVDCPITKGSRLVSLAWKTTEGERPDGYSVSIQKASGELPKEKFNITRTQMTFHLSCSAYITTISAFNNVSVSPALSQTITSGGRRVTGSDARKLNVTLHSNASLTVYWEAQLLKNYVCYSVELNRKQLKATYFSFFEDEQNNKTLDLTEPLEPYKRYTLFLHIRRNKDTCNLKSINSSERTYGRMHFYFEEGSPMSAPTNLSYYNLTATSLVLQWSPIPEEDLRGFLLGYKIDYKEYNSGSHTAEKTVIIDAESTSHVIEDLKPGTGYQVQISGYTRAGRGVLSIPGLFKTYVQVHEKNNMTILVFVATIALLTVACTLIKRTKVVFWPSIPNPENSNAIRNIERFCEVELLESLQTLKMEERDSHSVQIVKEAAGHLSWPILFAAENQEDSTQMCSEQIQEDTNKDNILDSLAQTELAGHANVQPAFTCGYTTLEMFQDAVKSHCSPIISNDSRGKLQDDVIALKPGQHYIGQFCSSPTFDMSTKG